MASKREVEVFINNQKSIQFYKKIRTALQDVLVAMTDHDYKNVTENLIIMAI